MRKHGLTLAFILLSDLLILPEVGQAEEYGYSSNDALKTGLFVYRPPKRGTLKNTTGGGSRKFILVQVLAPKDIGLTTQAQPRLYWYAKSGSNQKFQLNLIGSNSHLLDINLPATKSSGIQSLDLAQYHFQLKKGLTYHWQVTLEPIAGAIRQQLVSGGNIEFDDTDLKLIQTKPHRRPYIAAEHGFWYDALDWVSNLIETEADVNYWRQQRVDLLKQGGLLEVAILEQKIVDAPR